MTADTFVGTDRHTLVIDISISSIFHVIDARPCGGNRSKSKTSISAALSLGSVESRVDLSFMRQCRKFPWTSKGFDLPCSVGGDETLNQHDRVEKYAQESRHYESMVGPILEQCPVHTHGHGQISAVIELCSNKSIKTLSTILTRGLILAECKSLGCRLCYRRVSCLARGGIP